MLLSHKYKFIFIKTHKTAGTSIEVDFAKFMTAEDTVTPIEPPEDGHEPRNYHSRNLLRRMLGKDMFNHMTARRVRSEFGRKVYDSYFKFCVDREPVSKCLSQYRMFKKSGFRSESEAEMSWEDYIAAGKFPVNANIILDDDGSLMVDKVLRYEALNEELTALAKEQGWPFAGLKTNAKGGIARSDDPEVTQEQREIIYAAFAPTLKYTGYSL